MIAHCEACRIAWRMDGAVGAQLVIQHVRNGGCVIVERDARNGYRLLTPEEAARAVGDIPC